ncbi:hypothetical protein CN907_00325 [Bacillus anthracis]|nr:hypothetical protein CN907_00325 [Bacillus anthracis]
MLLFCFIQGKDLLSRSFFILSRYLPGSKTPPQNSAKVKKLGGGGLLLKAPLLKVSLYIVQFIYE